MDLPLKALRYFVATADQGNVTLAARLVNVSQPSISVAIRQLEEALGVQLFIRQHARGVALTPAGREVLREARKLLVQLNDFYFSATAVGEAMRGTLSVGCLSYLVPRYLASLIEGFTSLHPEIEIAFHEGGQGEMQRALMEGHIELALTYDLMLPGRLAIEPLLDLPPYVLVPAQHRLARRKAISLREICSEPSVLLDLPISRDYFASVFDTLGITPNVRYRTASVEAVRSFVANGLGYSVLNHSSKVLTAYDGKQTCVLQLTDTLQPARVSVVQLRDQKPRAIADAFVTYTREFFRKESTSPALPRLNTRSGKS